MEENDGPQHDAEPDEDLESSVSLNSLQMNMIGIHESYISARMAGFTAGQGLYLAACLMTGGPRSPLGLEDEG